MKVYLCWSSEYDYYEKREYTAVIACFDSLEKAKEFCRKTAKEYMINNNVDDERCTENWGIEPYDDYGHIGYISVDDEDYFYIQVMEIQ